MYDNLKKLRLERTISITSACAVLIIALICNAVLAQPLTSSSGSKAELMSAELTKSSWLAGLAINLETGYKTYWRQAGEAGLPPQFDWKGSENTKTIEVLWPAPTRFKEGDTISNGYKESVVFPIKITPIDETRPIKLKLSLIYGICKDVCIPKSETMSAESTNLIMPEFAKKVEATKETVPKKRLSNDLTIEVKDHETLVVTTKTPVKAFKKQPELFVEGEAGWIFSTSNAYNAADKTFRFDIKIEDRPKQSPDDNINLTLTWVGEDQTYETSKSIKRP